MLPLLNEYKEKMLRDGRKPITIQDKSKSLHYFEIWYGKSEMQKVTKKDIEQYKIYLLTEHKSRWSKKTITVPTAMARLSALSGYFRFLLEKKFIFFDPTLGMRLPKKKAPINQEYPSEKEIEELINKPDTYTYVGIRDRLLFELLYTCPLRNNEVCSLKVSDIDMKEKYIYPPRSKGGRECGIPIVPSTYQALEKYLEISRPRLLKSRNKHARPDMEELFVSQFGTPLTTNVVDKIFAKYRGGKMHIHPHAIRRACAVQMLKNGADIRDVQVLLGHNNIQSTQVYTPLAASDIQSMQSKYHPREKYPLLKRNGGGS